MRILTVVALALALAGCGGAGTDMRLQLYTPGPGGVRVTQEGARGEVDVRADSGSAEIVLPPGMPDLGFEIPGIEWDAATVEGGGERIPRAQAAERGGKLGQIPGIVHDLVAVAEGRTGVVAIASDVAARMPFAGLASSPEGWTATVERDGEDLRQVTVSFPTPELPGVRPGGTGAYVLTLG